MIFNAEQDRTRSKNYAQHSKRRTESTINGWNTGTTFDASPTSNSNL